MKNYGNKSEAKAWKQMREQKQAEDRVQGLLYLEQNSKAFAFHILTASTL